MDGPCDAVVLRTWCLKTPEQSQIFALYYIEDEEEEPWR